MEQLPPLKRCEVLVSHAIYLHSSSSSSSSSSSPYCRVSSHTSPKVARQKLQRCKRTSQRTDTQMPFHVNPYPPVFHLLPPSPPLSPFPPIQQGQLVPSYDSYATHYTAHSPPCPDKHNNSTLIKLPLVGSLGMLIGLLCNLTPGYPALFNR